MVKDFPDFYRFKVAGTIRLSSPAPKNGIVVKLSSSNPLVSVEENVKVKAGKTTAQFRITTFKSKNTKNTKSASVRIKVSYGGKNQSRILRLKPKKNPGQIFPEG